VPDKLKLAFPKLTVCAAELKELGPLHKKEDPKEFAFKLTG
jgi:hypothetical protein